jgi:hypothetical protein
MHRTRSNHHERRELERDAQNDRLLDRGKQEAAAREGAACGELTS